MKKQWLSLIDILFLGCYLVYSILPLSYMVDAPAAGLPRGGCSAFLLQETENGSPAPVLSAVFADASEGDDASSSTRVLLRKKRAISSSAKDLVANPLMQLASPSSASDGPEAVALAEPFLPGGPFRTTGYRKHYSGSSPPAEPYSDPVHLPSVCFLSLPETFISRSAGAGTFPITGREPSQTPMQALTARRTAAGGPAPALFAPSAASFQGDAG